MLQRGSGANAVLVTGTLRPHAEDSPFQERR